MGHDAWAGGDRETTETLVRSALDSMRGFNDHAMVGRIPGLGPQSLQLRPRTLSEPATDQAAAAS
ncbi:hypothetical protein [Streptomyces sp. IMTB 2501]|uniref:hypothetical protein n=1 Tax=Streptomyces sp. IMTB 2501 TaxID=1776340 RepID=UPI0015BFB06E|nr:hypothetical protein [Streptomyces sp. IMTB 2501]